MQFTCISGYQFVALDQLPALEAHLRDLCESLGIKGTILLGEEGVNIALAGAHEQAQTFMETFKQDPRFAHIEFKLSEADMIPFRRLRIRQKNEIIRMEVPTIDPTKKTAKHLSPEEFKQWLDENRDIAVLDTRNDYEVKVGTFKNAIDLHIENFRDFPERAKALPEALKEKPMVMFCTGGIRCEKASALFLEYGYKHVYQLDGGVIKYFEKCGGDYWNGECFVFDNRVAVKSDLSMTDQHYCLSCLEKLAEEDLKSDRYAYNCYCPHCYPGR